MYCKNCGEKLKEGASFCSKCGLKVKKKLKINSKVVFLLVFILLILILSSIGLYNNYYKNNCKKEELKIEKSADNYLKNKNYEIKNNKISYITTKTMGYYEHDITNKNNCEGYVEYKNGKPKGYVSCKKNIFKYKTNGFKNNIKTKIIKKIQNEGIDEGIKIQKKDDSTNKEEIEYLTDIPYDENIFTEDKIVAKYEAKNLHYGNDKCDELSGCNASITITLYQNNYMEINSGDGHTMVENTRGTYEVKNDELIYSRMYLDLGMGYGRIKKYGDPYLKNSNVYKINGNILHIDKYEHYESNGPTLTADLENTYTKAGFSLR